MSSELAWKVCGARHKQHCYKSFAGQASCLHNSKGLLPLQQRKRRIVQAAQQVFHHLVHGVLIACSSNDRIYGVPL